jgi:hypothetical protein
VQPLKVQGGSGSTSPDRGATTILFLARTGERLHASFSSFTAAW